jgi:hypothetical protein
MHSSGAQQASKQIKDELYYYDRHNDPENDPDNRGNECGQELR